jgi:aryl-phospho-beta-D-glucosidase BglC (GH1 family)
MQTNRRRDLRVARRLTAAVMTVFAILATSVMPPANASIDAVAATTPATGAITAQSGRFYLDGSVVALRGLNVEVNEYMTQADFDRIASWDMNLVRLRVHWKLAEPTAPTRSASGGWTHTYDADVLARIERYVAMASAAGLYTIIDNHDTPADPGTGVQWDYPDWLAHSAYNSHGITYPRTDDGVRQYNTDFWSDALRQQFMVDWMKRLAREFVGVAGVAGYEMLNEPQTGALGTNAATTQTVLDFQFRLARAVRNIDGARTIFFMTRSGYGPGLPQSDLSGWTALGNVAFDLHDGFGARWGQGLDGDPASPTYLQAPGRLNNNITIGGVPPYLGTTVTQRRIFEDRLSTLEPLGIPLLVGEFGDQSDDAGVMHVWGTILAAMCDVGGQRVSWAARDYRGPRGMFSNEGAMQPWANLVIAAAKKTC